MGIAGRTAPYLLPGAPIPRKVVLFVNEGRRRLAARPALPGQAKENGTCCALSARLGRKMPFEFRLAGMRKALVA